MKRIPNNILVFWHDVDNLPEKFRESIRTTAKNNPGYRLILAGDASITALIKREMPGLLELYERNRIPASRSDIARLLLLYSHGGVYIDISMEFQQSFDDLISREESLVLVRRDDLPEYRKDPESAHFINGMIAAPPGSRFILDCLKKTYFNLASGIHNYLVYVATGPIVVNEVFAESSVDYVALSYKALLQQALVLRRIPGISNHWVELQKNGIIDPAYYEGDSVLDEVWQRFQGPLD